MKKSIHLRWRWRRRAGRKPERCPRCGSRSLAPIVYGLPDSETMDAAKRGEISLGGCCVMIGQSHAWECRDCHESLGVVSDD